MGLQFQDETLADALKLALVAEMVSRPMLYTIPVQMPVFFVPSTYDPMNPTTMTPNPTQPITGSTKTLRPSYVAIPLYTTIPFHTLQAQAPPPPYTPLPHPSDSAFWQRVRRTAEQLIQEITALLRFLLEIAKIIYETDLALARDDQSRPSCDSGRLSSMLGEDDLLRVDMTELESIPFSELYLGEGGSTTTRANTPRLLSSRTRSSPPLRSVTASGRTLATSLETLSFSKHLPGLLQIPDDELYLDLEDLCNLGTPPPWEFNTSAFTPYMCRRSTRVVR